MNESNPNQFLLQNGVGRAVGRFLSKERSTTNRFLLENRPGQGRTHR